MRRLIIVVFAVLALVFTSCQKEETVKAPSVDEVVGTWVTPAGPIVGQLEFTSTDFTMSLSDVSTTVEFTGDWHTSIMSQCPYAGCTYPTIILDDGTPDVNTRYVGHSDGSPAIGVHFNTSLRVGDQVIKNGDYFVFSPAN